MTYAVVWTDSALIDLEGIRSYIENFNPYAAEDMAAQILQAADGLTAFPYRGRQVPTTSLRESALPFPYIIRYRIDESARRVIILRVRHGARRPG